MGRIQVIDGEDWASSSVGVESWDIQVWKGKGTVIATETLTKCCSSD